MTLFNHINFTQTWFVIHWGVDQPSREYYGLQSSQNCPIICDNHIRELSRSWLCKLLVDVEMHGSLFVDQNLYTDSTLVYVNSLQELEARYAW